MPEDRYVKLCYKTNGNYSLKKEYEYLGIRYLQNKLIKTNFKWVWESQNSNILTIELHHIIIAYNELIRRIYQNNSCVEVQPTFPKILNKPKPLSTTYNKQFLFTNIPKWCLPQIQS